MKVNIQKLARVVVPILTVFTLVLCAVIPASAASVDYIDYVVDVFETDGVEMCRVEIPASAFGSGVWYVQNRGNGQMLKTFSGHSFTYNFASGINYNLLYRPMQGGNRILTYDIPDGTVFSVNAYVKTASSDGYSGGNFTWYLQYYNSNSSVISSLSSSGSNGLDNSSAYGIFTLEKPDHTESIALYADFYNFSVLAGGYDWEIGVKSIVMTMTISSLYLQFIQNGRNNQIFNAVEKALAEQGKTLEDLLNGTADMNGSADHIKDNMDSSIKDIEDAGDAMDSFTPPTINVEQVLPDEVLDGQEFLAYTGAIKKFWDSPVLTSMFIFLGGLMFAGFAVFGKRG